MKTPERLVELAEDAHRLAVKATRAAVRASVAGRDRSAPRMADTRRLEIPGPGGPIEGRLYRPEGVTDDAPLMVFFHGGAFVISDPESHEAMCVRLADAGRFRMLSVGYRLAPEHRYPAQLEDALAAARWALGEGAEAVRSGGRIALGGDSAGGYLAAVVARRLWAERRDAISAQLLIYPLLELHDDAWAQDLLSETRAVGWAAMKYVRAALAAGADAPSLSTADDLAAAPALIVTGGVLDPCRGHAAAMAETLCREGRAVERFDYPALMHGFGSLTHLSPAARAALREIGEGAGRLLAAT
jgi:acetyl esterase